MSQYSSYHQSYLDCESNLSPSQPSIMSASVMKNRPSLYYWGICGLSTTVFLLLAGALSMSSQSQSSLSAVPALSTSLADSSNSRYVCTNPAYSSTTLKLAQEMSAIALFHDLKGQKKFEASSIIRVGSYFYIAFDNLWSLGRVAENLPFHSQENILIGSPGVDSGFEALVYDESSEIFYIIIETRPHIDKKRIESNMKRNNETMGELTVTGREEQFQNVDEDDPNAVKYHAVIQEVRLTSSGTSYDVVRSCDSEKEFTSGNKGLEGAALIKKNGHIYILGLCEGNFCAGGRQGRTAGNGRIVVMSPDYDAKDNPNGCEWKTVHEIKLPHDVNFVDYSALTLRPTKDENVYRMAIATQEGAQVWIGTLNVDTWQVGKGSVFNFPRNDNCDIIYCNIEGLHWLGDDMFVAVSDKMKSKGKQPYHCLPHDQSVHIFVLP